MNLQLSMELKGIEEAESKTVPIMKKVLWRVMNKIESISIRLVPVDTGLLRASIKLRPTSEGADEYVLSAETNYASFIEYGTLRMKSQPYFRPALTEVDLIWKERIWNSVLSRA